VAGNQPCNNKQENASILVSLNIPQFTTKKLFS
jgi:hypothetical protein